MRIFPLAAVVLAIGCGNPAENLPEPTATEIGTPTGSAISAMIGPAGGTVKTTDGRMTVRIPAGALSAETNITIQPITNTSHGARGEAYELLPDGQVFAAPAELTLTYKEEDFAGSAPEFLTWAFQNAQGLWEVQDSTLDKTAGTLTVSSTHFSRWSPGVDVEILPSGAAVKVGFKKRLVVQMCSFRPLGRDAEGRSQSRFTCSPASAGFASRALGAWKVDDVPGGNSTLGTVRGPELVDYTAPDQVPSPSKVLVNALVTAYDGKIAAPINTLIRIVPAGLTYGGRYTFTQRYGNDMTITGDADVVWGETSNSGDVINYKVTGGQLAAHFEVTDCDPADQAIPVDSSEMVVYTEQNSGFPRSYQFHIETNPSVNLRCGTPRRSVLRPVGVVLTGGLCHAPMLATYTDETVLSAMETCADFHSTASWNFTALE